MRERPSRGGGGSPELDIGFTGALMITGAGMHAPMLGLPAALLQVAGLVLIPYVTFAAIIAAARTYLPRRCGPSSLATSCGQWASFTVDRCLRYADDAGHHLCHRTGCCSRGAGRPAIRGAVPPANLYC